MYSVKQIIDDILFYTSFYFRQDSPFDIDMHLIEEEPYKFIAVGEQEGILRLRGPYEPLNASHPSLWPIPRLRVGPMNCHAGVIEDGRYQDLNYYSIISADHCVSAFSLRNIGSMGREFIVPALILLLVCLKLFKLPKKVLTVLLLLLFCHTNWSYLSMSTSKISLHVSDANGLCRVEKRFWRDDVVVLLCILNRPQLLKRIEPNFYPPKTGNLSIAVSFSEISLREEFVKSETGEVIPREIVKRFLKMLNAQEDWIFRGGYNLIGRTHFYSNVGSVPGTSGSLCYINTNYTQFAGVLVSFVFEKTVCVMPSGLEDYMESFRLSLKKDGLDL